MDRCPPLPPHRGRSRAHAGAVVAAVGIGFLALAERRAAASSLSAADLDGTAGFTINGNFGSGQAGFCVAGGRDVNGDGVDDLLLGAFGDAPHGLASGSSYVLFGTGAGFPAIVEVWALNGADGFGINGVFIGDFAGIGVDGAGDVNDDGIDDIVIGASAADPHGASSGAVYVVFGATAGFPVDLELSALDGTNGFVMNGVSTPDRSGRSVAGAGDVNGDSIDDIVIGAYNASPHGASSGRCYVVFGSASGFPAAVELSALDGANGFAINGIAAGDHLGISVDGAGDVNDDGIADVLVAAAEAAPHGSKSGAAYVVFGRSTAFPAEVELSTLDGIIGFACLGAAANDRTGLSVAGAGDVNDDGVADLVIGADGSDLGAPGAGAAYVVFGRSEPFPAALELSALDGTSISAVIGAGENEGAGFSVGGAGDFDGDGVRDLVFGAVRAAPNGSESGAGYVVLGRAGAWPPTVDLASADGTQGLRLDGAAAFDQTGYDVAGIGDVDGDGLDDVMIGAPSADPNGGYSGCAYVVFGSGDCNENGVLDAVEIASGVAEDCDANGVPDACEAPPCACGEDIDDDGERGFSDLLAILSTWGPCPPACPADLDGSGDVGFDDLLLLLGAWGPCP